MSKKALFYLAGIGLFIVVLSFGYYGSYQMALNRMLPNYSDEDNLVQRISDYDNEDYQDFTAELVETNTAEIDRITEDTQCILEVYDLKKNEIAEQTVKIQKSFYGFTRDEVLLYLEAFVEEMPDTEKEKGLVSYELVSFSENEMILRKSYDRNRIDYEYFLIAEGEEIVVMFSDKVRIYEYTGILISNFPKEDKDKLREGFYVKDKAELYGILENYSS